MGITVNRDTQDRIQLMQRNKKIQQVKSSH